MKAVVQRVSAASVSVGGETVGAIERGFLVLVGFGRNDTEANAAWMARKIVSLRIFEDDTGRMTLPLSAVGGRILVVSQFTLYGDCRKGARPGFDKSAPPQEARRLYERFLQLVETEAPGRVESGLFQEKMEVSLVNDGPVTLMIEND
ncbi:MAG: D-aminoacyl-tRNA deacylase [Candidatus Latescibacterota bacterium]|jgi:D-tyrosyl-tRNA(Tyr) deacylase